MSYDKFTKLLDSLHCYCVENGIIQDSKTIEVSEAIAVFRYTVKPVIKDKAKCLELILAQGIEIPEKHQDKLYRYACAMCELC